MSDGLEAGGTHRRAAAGLDVHFVGSPDVDVREHSGGRIMLSPLVNQLGEALEGCGATGQAPGAAGAP